MRVSRRRVRAIVRKELRAYRRNRSITISMSIIPLLFMVQPLVQVFALPASAAATLRHHHELLYLLGIPALVPVMLAAYAVVGERQDGTLEPLLSTPISRRELLLGKALAVLMPAVAVAYLVFAVFLALVALLADPSVSSALIRGPDVLAQVIFTPLLATWSVWVGIAISTRAGDIRVAQQLGVVASLPAIVLAALIAIGVIAASLPLALALAIALLAVNRVGWRVVSALFDRERLITATK
jgi:ABC-type transport system involved in multi-copper enzyme maturation permease subunit